MQSQVKRRRYIRHPSDIPIVYEPVDEATPRKDRIQNISLGGLCLQAASCLAVGTVLSIRIDLVRPPFEGRGRVVWCRPRDGSYEMGIQFLDPNTGRRARIVEQVCHIEQYKQDVLKREGRRLSGEEAALEWIDAYGQNFPT